jgi:hypothetical protein
VDFSSPIFFVGFFCREFWWGHCPWIVFSQIYFTFFMIYASRLRVYDIRLSSTCLWYTPLVYVFMIYASRLRVYDIRLSSTCLWYTSLVYVFMNLFIQCGLLCMFFVDFVFSLNPMSILHELLDTYTVQLLTK